MSIADWKRIADAPREPQQLKEGSELVLRIEVRCENAEDAPSVLSDIKRDAATLIKRGEHGVFDVQYCAVAARISIARSL